jgi:hypothetical protein
VFPVGIGLRDPRSQKRDLGHPSIFPFDVAEGTSFVVSLPTRSQKSAARDDKRKGCGYMGSGGWRKGVFIVLCGEKGPFLQPPLSPLSSRSEAEGSAVPRTFPGNVFLQSVATAVSL